MVFSKSFPAWWPVDTVTPCRLDGLHGLQALKALIAARNRILSLDGISPKKNPLLETVVLSHNRLETVSLAGKGGWMRRRASFRFVLPIVQVSST